MNNQAENTEVVQREDNTETQAASEEFSLQSIEAAFFYPDQFDAAQQYMAKIMTVCSPRFNWQVKDGEQHNIPDGFGLTIIPIMRRADKKAGEVEGNKVKDVIVAQVPTPETILAHQLGDSFIRRTLLDTLDQRLVTFFKSVDSDDEATEADWQEMPTSLEQFLMPKPRGEGLKSFAKLGPKFVKQFKANRLLDMTLDTLKSCLQSSDAAERIYPDYPQSVWQRTLKAMIKLAPAYEEKGKSIPLPTQIFQHWLDTRDETAAVHVSEEVFDKVFAKFGLDDDDVEESEAEAAE